jgi:hypothetical protein
MLDMGEEEGGKRAHGHNEATNCLKTKPKKKGGREKCQIIIEILGDSAVDLLWAKLRAYYLSYFACVSYLGDLMGA